MCKNVGIYALKIQENIATESKKLNQINLSLSNLFLRHLVRIIEY